MIRSTTWLNKSQDPCAITRDKLSGGALSPGSKSIVLTWTPP